MYSCFSKAYEVYLSISPFRRQYAKIPTHLLRVQKRWCQKEVAPAYQCHLERREVGASATEGR